MVVSPTSIKISWEDDGGINGVNGYIVSYERVTGATQQGPCPFNSHGNELIIDSPNMEYGIIIPELEEFSTYAIEITAKNDVGYSSPRSWDVTTWEAGKYSYKALIRDDCFAAVNKYTV